MTEQTAAAPPAHTPLRAKRRRKGLARARAKLDAALDEVSTGAHQRMMSKAAAGRSLLDEPRALPDLDPLEAAQEAQRHAQEGNLKLSKAVEIMREGLELIVFAEEDHKTGLPVTAKQLRQFAVACLDRYSAHIGQNWRKAKLTGATRAGDKSLDEKAILESLREV